jgi:hypothetical protein
MTSILIKKKQVGEGPESIFSCQGGGASEVKCLRTTGLGG